MRYLRLPGPAPLLDNSASKQRTRFSVQALAHTDAYTQGSVLPGSSLGKYRARRTGKIIIIIITRKSYHKDKKRHDSEATHTAAMALPRIGAAGREESRYLEHAASDILRDCAWRRH